MEDEPSRTVPVDQFDPENPIVQDLEPDVAGKLDSVTDDFDDLLFKPIMQECEKAFNGDRTKALLDEINLPTSMTPSDLDRIAHIERKLSSDLFFISSLVNRWGRMHSKFEAMLLFRTTQRDEDISRAMVRNSAVLSGYRSQGEKTGWILENVAGIQETKWLAYFVKRLHGWFFYFFGIQKYLLGQIEVVKTHSGNIKASLSYRPGQGFSGATQTP